MDSPTVAGEIVNTLVKEGYTAYFAGGWVRDYLMGHPSDDVDIATDAPPEVILNLFPRTILVGLAFGVVVVVEKGHQFEVATFRRDIGYVDGRKPTKIELATPQEDAERRDFTINGMFYDPAAGEVHDFVGGIADIKARMIKTIGDPYERFVEDRLRMIRAVRFAARFDFSIHEDTMEAIRASADTLFPAVAMERVWQEFTKMAKYPRMDHALKDMHRLGLLEVIFPKLRDIHFNEIKHRVEAFQHYPENVSPAIYLMSLFPNATQDEAVELFKYLKASVAEGNLAQYLVRVREAAYQEDVLGKVDLVTWVHLYADKDAWMCLRVVAAHLPPLERGVFLEHHQARMERLRLYIDCVRNKKPLLTAAMLQFQGVPPGKIMGGLLKEAEKLAIEHEIKDGDQLMLKLKESKAWRDYVETAN